MSGLSKASGSLMLFLFTLLSYTSLKEELVYIVGNSTLTNAGAVILNTVFGLIWILMAVMFLVMAIYYALR